jgi:4-amino-4-deoxy-L-arabinose transferase-like glycosyltransferase
MLLTLTVFLRTPIPVDETRYLSVAWEMWLRGDFWLPYLNGQIYDHKPPLLFWLFQLGWAVFGVNDWWPALVGPLAALVNLLLLRQLASKLWPEQPQVALLAPWILIATLLWTLFATTAMFDILLTCCVLLGMLGLQALQAGTTRKGHVLLAMAIGLGLLAKGPVIFLHLLPVALLARFWAKDKTPHGWYMALWPGFLLGICIALAWAIPAAIDGGEDYAHAILWRQVANRTIATEIHVRPFYWYWLFLPAILFPWIFWSRLWKDLSLRQLLKDDGQRFCLVWLLGGLLIFSAVSSKQIHYLIPLLPAFALLVARVLVNSVAVQKFYGDLWLVLLFALIGLFLLCLPNIPRLSSWHWVQAMDAVWGGSVLTIALILAFCLLWMRRLPVVTVALSVVLAVFVSVMCFFNRNEQAFNLKPSALQVKNYQQQGIPCAYVGTYHGQLNFLGRLTQPIPVVDQDQVASWVAQHPDGFLLSMEKVKPQQAAFLQGHREYWLVFRPASQYQLLRPL